LTHSQAAQEGKPWGNRHTELVLIGVDMNKKAVLAALDLATLTDAEMAVDDAPEAWQKLKDPFFPAGALDYLLGTTHSKEGDHAKALQHHKVALAKRAEALPAGHTEIARSHVQIGIAHSELEHHAEALVHLKVCPGVSTGPVFVALARPPVHGCSPVASKNSCRQKGAALPLASTGAVTTAHFPPCAGRAGNAVEDVARGP